MTSLEGHRETLHGLRTAADHLLHRLLPHGDAESRDALETFVDWAKASPVSWLDMESTLLQCVKVLNGRRGAPLPSLVDQFLLDRRPWERHDKTELLDRFASCVKTLNRPKVGHPKVDEAIALMQQRYWDSALNLKWIARRVNLHPGSLSEVFTHDTGETFSRRLRHIRLDRAAHLLASTNKSTKEVWTAVGCNDHSNFHHHFHERFAVAPGEYRARLGTTRVEESTSTSPHYAGPVLESSESLRISGPIEGSNTPDIQRPNLGRPDSQRRVLLVEDDEETLHTNGRFLQQEGFDIVLASSGEEGFLKAKRLPPDAILSDYHLGDVDGPTLCRRLRGASGRALPAAILTVDWFVDQDELLAQGLLVVLKPCWLDELLAVTTHLIGPRTG